MSQFGHEDQLSTFHDWPSVNILHQSWLLIMKLIKASGCMLG
jgi:hypothetical protein